MNNAQEYIKKLEEENRILKELEASRKEVLWNLFDSHQAIMLLIHASSGEILDANEAAVKFYKYSKEDLLKLKIEDINVLPPNDVKKERMKTLNKEKNYFLFPHRLANGTIRQVEVYSSAYELNKEPVIFSIIHDVTERVEAEKELKNNEEKFVSAFRSNPNSMIISNLEDGKIHDVNDAFFELTGMSRDDITGQTTLSIDLYANPADRDKIIQIIKERKSIRDFEIKFRHRSGKTLTVLIAGETLDTSSGKTLITTLLDITKRVELEKQLERNNVLLQTIFDSVPAMITIYNPDLQKIDVNNEFVKITGWTHEDIQSYNLMELVYPNPEHRKVASEFMQSLLPGYKDFIMKGKDGSEIETIWANVKLEDGRHVGIGIDIRDRKKAQKEREKLLEQLAREKTALADSEKLYRTMGEAVDFGVWATDSEGRAVYTSESFCELVGKSFEEIQEFGWIDTLIPEQRKEVLELWTESVTTGKRFEHEHEFICKDGTTRTVLAIGNPVKNAKGKIISWAGINLDITKRKKIEKELEEKNAYLTRLNEILEDFVKIAAHDLRSPIQNLMSISNLIEQQNSIEDKVNLLRMLDPIAKRLQRTIEGLVETVSLQIQQKLPVANLHFQDLWEVITEDLSKLIDSYNGRIKVDFKQAPDICYIEAHLTSILRNLVSNAIKYSAESENSAIKISTKKEDGFILVAVEDNGFGINLEEVGDNLFKPFRRFTTVSEGLGMGLYIVKNIVERSGGYVNVRSTPGKGTTFLCYLKEYQVE